jgi:hypothetical protein
MLRKTFWIAAAVITGTAYPGGVLFMYLSVGG